MRLEEELFEKVDDKDVDLGIKTTINDLIKAQYDIINKYATAIATFEDLNISDYTETLLQLLKDTNDGIKKLESLIEDDNDDSVTLQQLLDEVGVEVTSNNIATILLYIIENKYPEEYKQLKDGKYSSDDLLNMLSDLGVKFDYDSVEQKLQEHVQRKQFKQDIKKVVEKYISGGDQISNILADSFINNTEYTPLKSIYETVKRRRRNKGISLNKNAGDVGKSTEFFNHIMSGGQLETGEAGVSAGGDMSAAAGAASASCGDCGGGAVG